MMATTTGTTRATTTGSGWGAAETATREPIFTQGSLWPTWGACRKGKRSSRDAQRYDQHLLDHLVATKQALPAGKWCPRRSRWFVTSRPTAREVHCAEFGDRVVHHWLVPRLDALFVPVFIHDSHSNRAGHRLHYAVDRLQHDLRSATANGTRKAWVLQIDIGNFVNCIDRPPLYRLIEHRVHKDWRIRSVSPVEAQCLLCLTRRVFAQVPAQQFRYIGAPGREGRVPGHNRLSNVPRGLDLAINNLPSQLFANIYLNEMDQFIKHRLGVQGYVRYVDNFVLVGPHRERLLRCRTGIEKFIDNELGLRLRDAGRLAEAADGLDFLGYMIRPGYRLVRRRVIHSLQEKRRIFRKRLWRAQGSGLALNAPWREAQALRTCLDSYLGHFRHARTWRLTRRVLARNHWLPVLCRLLGGPRLQPLWQPPSVVGLKSQWFWFRKHFPEALVLLQVGREFEIFTNRPARKRPPACCRSPCRAHIFVAEQGYLPEGLKRCVLRLGW